MPTFSALPCMCLPFEQVLNTVCFRAFFYEFILVSLQIWCVCNCFLENVTKTCACSHVFRAARSWLRCCPLFHNCRVLALRNLPKTTRSPTFFADFAWPRSLRHCVCFFKNLAKPPRIFVRFSGGEVVVRWPLLSAFPHACFSNTCRKP